MSRVSHLSEPNTATVLIVVIVAAYCLAYVIARLRRYASRRRGEARLARLLQSHFDAPDYRLLNNVTLRVQDGTTQIDHILVSRFGIFVIETKHYKGWIFGNARDATWTQVLFRRKFRFQNPIHQNYGHLRAVQDLLAFLPKGATESAVVFTGGAEFKTAMPAGVFTMRLFLDHVRRRTTEIVTLERVQMAVDTIESRRLAVSRETDREHLENLRRRHRSLE